MPGHKRRLEPVDRLPYAWDVTEVPGTDDLHDAQGILKDAMDRAQDLFGSRRTWFLVGGSTCGILAAIRSVCPYGSEIIAARNCHKSVYHAIEIGHLEARWIWPQYLESFGIPGSVLPEDVEQMLKRYPGTKAVIVTSPTYEGIVSDIEGIAAVCHAVGAALIVDEAHGTHLGLFREASEMTGEAPGLYFPDSAVHLGADIIIQSAHKTLPSLTQTAFLHIGSRAVYADPDELERQLDIFETSSPSYPLMVSLDGCVGLLDQQGQRLFSQWRDNLLHLYERAIDWSDLRILARRTLHGTAEDENHGREGDSKAGCVESGDEVFALDPGKILIRPSCSDREPEGGRRFAGLLREKYGIVCEMENSGNVLLMTSCADDAAAFAYLETALEDADRVLEEWRSISAGTFADKSMCEDKVPSSQDPGKIYEELAARQNPAACGIEEAARSGWEELPAEQSAGRICAEYIYPYPPGIPVLIPGEIITEEKTRMIAALRLQGADLRQDKTKAAGNIAVTQ